jgi:hypothetical protein
MSDALVPTVDPRLWGLTTTTTAGVRVRFVQATDGDDGAAGVREPRRPSPQPPALAAALHPSPEPQTEEVSA